MKNNYFLGIYTLSMSVNVCVGVCGRCVRVVCAGLDRGVAPHTTCVSREGVFPKGWGGGRGESVLCALCNVVSGGERNCVREVA